VLALSHGDPTKRDEILDEWLLEDLTMAYLEAVRVHEREKHKMATIIWAIRGGKSKPPTPPRFLTEE
jgi:hypothetical protein